MVQPMAEEETVKLAKKFGVKNCVIEQGVNNTRPITCFWEYSFRDQAARQKFENLIKQAQSCFAKDAELAADLQVNHPDSYTLRRFEDGPFVFSISLKDKGALQKTLVFLRRQ